MNSDDSEAILDAEWASAAAPGAAIVVAACADTTSITSGLLIAMQNLVNASTPPPIMSMSYGICEAENGASSNASINALYQQAVAEGISVFVAAGDEGAASCDAGERSATHGIGVSGFASTPYNVAVGGTDFSDVLNGTTSTTGARPTRTTYGSALSYIPEIPWNDSCAGSLLANYYGLFDGLRRQTVFATAAQLSRMAYSWWSRGSGGPSNCATGVPSIAGVASGSCRGICQARVADRSLRHPQRRRARHPRRFHVRFGRHLGTLLRHLLFRPGKWRNAMHGSSQQLGRSRRHLPRDASHGRHSGSGEPECGRQSQGNPNYCLLRAGREHAQRVPQHHRRATSM